MAQAINSTAAAAPISTSSSTRVLPSASSLTGTTTAPMLVFELGNCRASSAATRRMSSLAAASETPGESRATTFRKCEP